MQSKVVEQTWDADMRTICLLGGASTEKIDAKVNAKDAMWIAGSDSSYQRSYQQLPEELDRGLCPKDLLGRHVDIIHKQHHVLACWRTIPIKTQMQTSVQAGSA